MLKRIIIFALSLSITLSAVQILSADVDNEDINEAIATFESGDYQRALTEFESLLRQESDNPGIIGNIGNCYYMLGNKTEAASYYNQALEIDPANYQATYNLALIEADNGNITTAINLLSQEGIIVPRQDRVQGYYLLGDLYYTNGDVESAKSTYHTLLSFIPETMNASRIYRNLGYLYLESENYVIAFDYLSRVEGDYANSYTFNINYGILIDQLRNIPDMQYMMLYQRGSNLADRVDELFNNLLNTPYSYYYLSAMELEPANETPYLNLLFNYFLRKEYDNALEFAIEAGEQFPESYFYTIMAGLASYKQGLKIINDAELSRQDNEEGALSEAEARDIATPKFQDAATYFESALDTNPNAIEAYKYAGFSYLFLESYSDTLFNLKTYLDSNPNDIDSVRNYAVAVCYEQAYDNGIVFLSELLEQTGNQNISKYLGLFASKLGNYEDAVNYYTDYFTWVTDDYRAFYNIGIAHCFLDEYDDAIEALEQSVYLYPLNYDAHLNLGILYEKTGDYSKANEHYLFAVSIDEERYEGYFGVASVHARQSETLEAYQLLDDENIPSHIDIIMDYLSQAKDHGFDNLCAIYENTNFDSIRAYQPFVDFIQENFPGYVAGQTCD